MSGRETVLAKIRKGLAVQGAEPDRHAVVEGRLSEPKSNLIPERGKLSPAEQVNLFCAMAEKAQATLTRVNDFAAVPREIADYLRGQNQAPRLRMGEDPVLGALPWDDVPQIELATGPSDGSDHLGLSRAFAGVAESGTLVLRSGPNNPTTLNFLPDTHIVVISSSDIAGDYESVWRRLREVSGHGGIPRTVNWITGPSRSADIEQTLLLGAHGPRALHIVVVDDQ